MFAHSVVRCRSAAGLALVFALTGGCSQTGTPDTGDRLIVVATTTVVGDFVDNVGGQRVDVHVLVPAGGEPHTFDPSPSDVTRLEGAAIVFRNGLGLDDWLSDLVTDAGTQAPVVALGEGLEGVEYRSSGTDDAGEGHDAAAVDPHVWLNVAYAERYVERIADELAAIDPDHAAAYEADAAAYISQLESLDAYARSTLGAIPESRRSVVSFHEAFSYFAQAYGLTLVDTVVAAPGQDPSAGEVAALIDEIRATGVRAILAESQFPTDLVERIAEETGATVVGGLFSDSLGDPPIDTYIAGIRFDVDTIAQALR
ncbi:MAG: metal ABC transporter substrate-binding protein [Candidatus Limnocylindria bacterium]